VPNVKPVLLVILDGWGTRAAREANAIAIAGTPNVDALANAFPTTQLETSGNAVGLPDGQMGNSEVGHVNLGAGRVVYQDLVRINRAVADGELFRNEALVAACRKAKAAGGAVHFMGLLSDGGVHSQQEHLYALLDLAQREGVARACVHAFMDGRDTPPKSGIEYMRRLKARIAKTGYGTLATVMGRFFAMDRDKRWDRVEQAYAAMVRGVGVKAKGGVAALEHSYEGNETDEFVRPTVIVGADGQPNGTIRDGDAVVFFNFRSDRAREITHALTDAVFKDFERGDAPKLSAYVCMTEYDRSFGLPVAFPPQSLDHIFPQLVSEAGLAQLRCAETEKYAHVTFFFNGGRELVFPGEDRILVPSPRDVKTYDQKPEMSAREVADKLVGAVASQKYGLIVANFANPDMVGHTGVLEAAVKAVRTVDECVGRLAAAAKKAGMAMLVTADHGNCEMMVDPVTGEPHTAHTLNPVPFILACADFKGAKLRPTGVLADVAPTAIQVMGLAQPAEMKGLGLVVK
jgi:2,3-bisphosphoglycerate-independent phosphoglycerate mutase